MDKNSNIHIRRAEPGDASFLARIMIMAGRAHVHKGIWEVVLGGTEREVETFLHHISITQIPHLFHYSHFLVAEEDTVGPVGGLGGYDPKMAGYQFLRRAIPEVVQKLDIPMQAVKDSMERSTKILACLPGEMDDAWVVDSVATLPEHRGKGVAESLVREILKKGKEHGYSQAQLNVYIGNEPALRLYRKFGFQTREEKRDPYFEEQIGAPGMVSLVTEL